MLRVALCSAENTSYGSSPLALLFKLRRPIITYQLIKVDYNWPRGRGAEWTVFLDRSRVESILILLTASGSERCCVFHSKIPLYRPIYTDDRGLSFGRENSELWTVHHTSKNSYIHRQSSSPPSLQETYRHSLQ